MSNTEKVIAYVMPPSEACGRAYNEGYVMACHGEIVSEEMSFQGVCLGDWHIDEITPKDFTGIMVWEGGCENVDTRFGRDPSGESWEPNFKGTWRRPTLEELWAVAEGQAA